MEAPKPSSVSPKGPTGLHKQGPHRRPSALERELNYLVIPNDDALERLASEIAFILAVFQRQSQCV